jgi:hypothetical protein
LKAFWNVILPVPVTLNRFLALEFVFTLGILYMLYYYTLLALRTGRDLWSRLGNVAFRSGRKQFSLKERKGRGFCLNFTQRDKQ